MTGELVADENGKLPLSSLAVRMQKKLAGRLASSKALTKQLLLSESEQAVFNALHLLLVECMPKPQADKLVKALMKLALKVGVLARNGLLDQEEEARRLHSLHNHVNSLVKSVISFSQVAYSYERNFLLSLAASLREELEPLVTVQLSDKSSARLAFVFDTLCTPKQLDELFREEHSGRLDELAACLERLLEQPKRK